MSTNKTRIFIMDDDESFLFVLKRHLERKNIFEIHTFNTGEAGINQLHLNPEILILDYNLNRSGSRLNGREIMQIAKQQLKNSKIVMLSGQQDGQLVLELIQLGIRDYIVKGINSLDELDEILNLYMSENA
jgi:DNA-binding NarL/FixJ family response regulator